MSTHRGTWGTKPFSCAMCFPSKVCLFFSLQLFHIELNGFDFQTSPLLCIPKFPFQHVKRPITELSITQLTSKRHKTSIDNSCSIGRCRNKWPIIHTIIPCLWWNKVSVIPVYEGKHIAQWSIIHTIIPLIDFYQLVIINKVSVIPVYDVGTCQLWCNSYVTAIQWWDSGRSAYLSMMCT